MTPSEPQSPETSADEILRGTVGGGAARVVAVTTTGVAREAIRRHEATGAAAVALARGVTAGLLLATVRSAASPSTRPPAARRGPT
jgi:redox-regulated HSP33 family molecular chaperone